MERIIKTIHSCKQSPVRTANKLTGYYYAIFFSVLLLTVVGIIPLTTFNPLTQLEIFTAVGFINLIIND